MVTYSVVIIVYILSSLMEKKRYRWKSTQNCYSVMQIMTAKTTTLRTLYVHVVLNIVMVVFHKFYILFYMLDTFLSVMFFPKYYFNKPCFELPKFNVDWWITRMISTSTGINGVRLAHHISEARMVTYHYLLFFSKQCVVENIQEKFQKIHRQLLFLRNHLKAHSAFSITVFSMISKYKKRRKIVTLDSMYWSNEGSLWSFWKSGYFDYVL